MATLDVDELHRQFTKVSRSNARAVQNLNHHWKNAREGQSLQKLLGGEVQSYNMLDYNLRSEINFIGREEHLQLYNLIEEKYKNPGKAPTGINLTGQPGIGTS